MPAILAWRDYLHTGDARQLAADYDLLVARDLGGYRNAAGLVEKAPGSASQANADLVDWPEASRDGYVFTSVNTVVNSWQYAAYAALARIAEVLGRTGDAAAYTGRAADLRAAVNRELLDPVAGHYVDGATSTHAAQHATVFPVALGVARAADLPVLGGGLAAGGVRTGVYGAQFLLDALYRCGLGDAGHAVLTGRGQSSWMHMIDDLGATIVMEAWDPAVKANTTFSHAWGSAPANIVATGVAGVRVLEPGAALIGVAPRPGPLLRFAATVPTVRGPVRVALDRDAPFTLDVTLPPNARGRIELDLFQLGLPDPDRLAVCSAGTPPARDLDAGRLSLTGVAPGHTRITRR
jgi:alpha-L-rhamnosidase